jgi:hypothetical protein
MRHLYSIYAEGEDDSRSILKHMMNERSVVTDGGATDCMLTLQYEPATSLWRIDLLVSEFTQEITGKCWDALIAAHMSFPRDVWLSTYDSETIVRVAPARSRMIGQLTGYVLHPHELDLLLDSIIDLG